MLDTRRHSRLHTTFAEWWMSVGVTGVVGAFVGGLLVLGAVLTVAPNFYHKATVWDALLATRSQLHQLVISITNIQDEVGADSVQLYSYHKDNGRLYRGKFNVNVGQASAAGDSQDYEIHERERPIYWQQWKAHERNECWHSIVEDLPGESWYSQIVKENGRFEVASCPIGKLGYVAASWNKPMPFEYPEEAIATMKRTGDGLWSLLSPPVDY